MARSEKNQTAEVVSRQIEKYFSHQILSGVLVAGSRLPTNRALAAEWSTSCNTVQNALANLAAAGLIERATARGSFVRSHQNRAIIGILVGPNLNSNSGWFYRNLVQALQNEIETEHLSSRIYTGLSFEGNIMLKALKQDEKYLNFTGFVEVATARSVDSLRFGNAPRVVFDTRLPENCLEFDWADCSKRMAITLREQKIRSAWIVYSRTAAFPNRASWYLERALSKFHPIPHELLEVAYDAVDQNIHASGYEYWNRCFSEKGRDFLPEAIIVSDDGLLSSLLYAILKYGVEVPRKVKIFVITSQGADLFSPVPVTQFAFPTQKAAETLAKLLRERLRGLSAPSKPVVLKGDFL